MSTFNNELRQVSGRKYSLQWCYNNWRPHEVRFVLIITHKNDIKWTDLNIQLHGHGIDYGLLDMTPKVWTTKGKVNGDSPKSTILCIKRDVKKLKNQANKMEENACELNIWLVIYKIYN